MYNGATEDTPDKAQQGLLTERGMPPCILLIASRPALRERDIGTASMREAVKIGEIRNTVHRFPPVLSYIAACGRYRLILFFQILPLEVWNHIRPLFNSDNRLGKL